MPGESPLNMMQPGRRPQRAQARVPARRRRMWPVFAVVAVALALGWFWLWYFAASVTDRTLSGWVAREAAAGRVYSCGKQSVGGFPFSIEAHCVGATAQVKGAEPPFTATAKDVTFSAQVYRPTQLVGDITGPLTLSDPGQPPSLIANWSRAELSVYGVPPEPDSFAAVADQLQLDRVAGGNTEMLFTADHIDFGANLVDGSPRNNPVVGAVLRFNAASAPTLHPLLTDPLQGEIDVVVRGFKDLSPKHWSTRFREMQASGGNIEIKSLRIERSDALIVGTGTLTVNEHGKLDGLIRVAVIGVEKIVPLLGIDRLIGRGIDRLTGTGNQPSQGLNALDRIVPGLSGVVRDNANASIVESIKKMGQPTEIDGKQAILLPLRVSDGAMFLGIVPLGEIPPLF